MSTLSQTPLFSWENVDRSRPIQILEAALDALPDERLVEALIRERKGKRNDYPLEPLWRATVAGGLLGHATTASLIAELRRNAELRQVCGFEPALAEGAVPPDYVFSRFYAKLEEHQDLLDAMFAEMTRRLGEWLPDLGEHLAVDSKALVVRGRRPEDAGVGTKTYESVDEKGDVQKTVVHWFGYKLHLLIDSVYELPLGWEVTEPTCADSPRLMPLVEKFEEEHPDLHERAETLSADKGYDDGADKADLWDHHDIKPLIPPRDMSRGGPRQRPLDESRSDTIYIGPGGEVLCKIDPFNPDESQAYVPMQFQGFEADRGTLKFRCPAAAYGLECRNRDACACPPLVRDGEFGRVVRVPLDRDRRLFLPVHAPSHAFARAYKRRTAVERVNARLDRVHGLEWALVHSRARMTLRVAMALLAMQASALAWLEAGQPGQIRKLLRAA